MKPSSIYASRTGVFPLAPSLDHVGPIARTVGDLRLVFGAIVRTWKNMKEWLANDPPLDTPPRLGRLRGFFDKRAEPVVKMALDETVRALTARGAEVVELDDPVDFERILIEHRIVMAAEAARIHSDWFGQSPDDYPTCIQELIREGNSLWAQQYLRAKDEMDRNEQSLWSFLEQEKLRALITPATVGTAPDPTTTGDPAFNSLWSFTGLPTVSFPTGSSPDGLPVAVQVVACPVDDIELLRTAQWCEQAIRNSRL
jgi:Asp-tRNA(Asn)/Glu-tRNA(Gln) amidotransferase A subunit family amidase